MKKKQKLTIEEMGVSIEEGTVFSGESKSTAVDANYVVGLLLFTMMMVGTVECLVQGFSMPCMQKWLVLGILVSCLVFYTGFSSKRGGEIVVALYLVGYGIVSYLMRNHIANGLAVFVNTILKKAGKYYRVNFVSYEEYADLDRQKSLTIFLLFVFVFLVGVLAYLVAHKIASCLVIAVTLVIAFAPEVVGLVPGERAFALYTVSVLVYWGSRIIYKNGYKISADQMRVQWKVRLMQIVVGTVCIFLFFRVFTEDTYDKISRETDLKTFVQKTMQACYNNTIRKGMDKGTVDGGISFGDISGVDRIQYSDTVRLRVRYRSLDLGERAEGGLYLRGYMGSKYEGDQWCPLSDDEETECRKMEEKSGISLDDYDTATASYRMGLEEFLQHEPMNSINVFHEETAENLQSNYKFTEGKRDFWYKKYEPELFRNGMNEIGSQMFSNVIVENVSETVSTQFMPYYVVANVEEKQGKLSSEETTDVGEYEWNIFNGQAGAFGVVTNPYMSYYDDDSFLDYYDKMKILWKEFSFVREKVEDALGGNILDYKEGAYKGKIIKDVCPDLSKKLELTIYSDTAKSVEGINTDGEYNVNELLRILARESTSAGYDLADSEMHELYSGIQYGMTDSEFNEFQDAADSSSLYHSYSEKKEVWTWQEIYGSEQLIRYLREDEDADDFFSLLKHMYQFYIQQQEYEQFVERTYMDVPENIKGKLDNVVEEAGMKGEKDLRKTIFFVQNYLYDNTEYSLEPGVTPEGEDFTEYFLFQNKKGYCVHYATAAAMMFRSMGVPARYVEGYHADKETLQNNDTVTMEGASLLHTVELTDRYAHAWVEIYISGYGWVPVEATKAYLDLGEEKKPGKTENEDTKQEPTAKSTKKPSDTAEPIQQTAKPQSSGNENAIDITKYYGVLRVFFGMAAVLLVVAMRYGIITRKHRKEGNLGDANRAIYFYYTQMEQMLQMLKQCGKNQSLRQLLREQTIKLDGIDADEWLRFYVALDDYTFSKNGVTESQAADGKQLYEMVRAAFYREKKIWTRWYYKYIRCI